MKDFLNKLSSYNLFNYLLPGIIFVILAKALCDYSFIQQDVILGFFLYYFIGLTVSRIGSLIIEPLLMRVSFLHFVEYSDFVSASKKDEKIELLSEVNNTYRTFCSLFLILSMLKLYRLVENKYADLKEWNSFILLFFLLIIFLFSYRKQTFYIIKRVERVKNPLKNLEKEKGNKNELD